MDDMRTCSIIGLLSNRNAYRLDGQDEYYLLLRSCILKIIEIAEDTAEVRFSIGMEHNLDLSIAEMILELKDGYSNITLECVTPYETITDRWTKSRRERYFEIMERCDGEKLLMKTYKRDYKKRCIHYLISQSQYILLIDVAAEEYGDRMVKELGTSKRISRISMQSASFYDCIGM